MLLDRQKYFFHRLCIRTHYAKLKRAEKELSQERDKEELDNEKLEVYGIYREHHAEILIDKIRELMPLSNKLGKSTGLLNKILSKAKLIVPEYT